MLNKLYGMDSCDGCALHKNGFVVPGKGSLSAKIMVIGEAPGEKENYAGEPFIGPAGEKLKGYLALAGLTIEDVYLTNSCKHWPGEGNPTPSLEMVRACRPWLDLEIEMVDPDTIICLGKTAAVNILGAVDMKKAHGTSVVIEVGGRARTVHVLYHPAAGLHNPGLVPVIEEDFRNLANSPAKYMEDVQICWIHSQYQNLPFSSQAPLSVDLETTSLDTRSAKITAVSWSQDPSIGYVGSPSPGTLSQLASTLTASTRIIGHNFASFDRPILARYGLSISTDKLWDTMLSAYILGRDQSLKTRALRELNILMETYKQASGGKKNSAEADPWKLYPYAAVDAVVPLLLYERDRAEIHANHAEEGLWIEHQLTPIFNEMHVRGIRFDGDKARVLEGELNGHINGLRDDIYGLIGHEVDLNYSQAVAGLLFEELKLKPGKKTPSKANWSTDEEVLKGLVGAHPIIPLLLDYRKHSKMVSTYVTSPLALSEDDGRLHSRFKQAGARGGRTSSEDPNLQNIPQRNGWDKKIKELFLPDEGELLVEWDFCLAPETRVLGTDLRWRHIGNIEKGMELVGISEEPTDGSFRRTTKSTVEAVKMLSQPCYRITMEDGRLITASKDHPWLVRRKNKPFAWIKTEDLNPTTDKIARFVDPWTEEHSKEAGWLAGFFDGEGWLSPGKPRTGALLGIGQNPGASLDKCLDLIRNRNYKFVPNKTTNTKHKVQQYRLQTVAEILRFLGEVRPERLLQKADSVWINRTQRKYGRLGIKSVEFLGTKNVVAIQTSAKTFVAEGLFTHNSQLEYRVGAALSEDPVLLEIYRNDEDLHDYNTKYILGREPGNPDDRRLAKNVGFGLTFRMGAKGLQGYLATVAEPPILISMKEAIRLYNVYHERFSHMFLWQDGIIEAAKATGYGENLFHYRRYLPELGSDDPNTVKEAEKIAVNIPYQGTAGVITKKALTKLAQYPILNTVHDSILMSVKPQWVKIVGEDVQRIMEKTAEEILGIPVKVEWGSGSTWARCK